METPTLLYYQSSQHEKDPAKTKSFGLARYNVDSQTPRAIDTQRSHTRSLLYSTLLTTTTTTVSQQCHHLRFVVLIY